MKLAQIVIFLLILSITGASIGYYEWKRFMTVPPAENWVDSVNNLLSQAKPYLKEYYFDPARNIRLEQPYVWENGKEYFVDWTNPNARDLEQKMIEYLMEVLGLVNLQVNASMVSDASTRLHYKSVELDFRFPANITINQGSRTLIHVEEVLFILEDPNNNEWRGYIKIRQDSPTIQEGVQTWWIVK